MTTTRNLLEEDVQPLLLRIEREVRFILRYGPPCPDPTNGGCIGEHCPRCAANEIDALIAHARMRAGQ